MLHKVFLVLSVERSCLIATLITETVSLQDLTTGRASLHPAVIQTNKTSCAHPKRSAKEKLPFLPVCYSWFLDDIQLSLLRFPAQQSQYKKLELSLERCWNT